MYPFHVSEPKEVRFPILVSSPHSGYDFPEEIIKDFEPSKVEQPDDTDWYVGRLYSFVTELGIPLISSKYCRWVIDLNRFPDNRDMYDDGRIITSLAPITDFKGESIYRQGPPSPQEIDRRKKEYFDPYHNWISERLGALKKQFGVALLWDAHSIRNSIPSIHKDPFPDLIIGNDDHKTTSSTVFGIIKSNLEESEYEVSDNYPFKGGYITRSFGDPLNNIMSVQLEMSKLCYMDDEQVNFHPDRAENIIPVLKRVFESVGNHLCEEY